MKHTTVKIKKENLKKCKEMIEKGIGPNRSELIRYSIMVKIMSVPFLIPREPNLRPYIKPICEIITLFVPESIFDFMNQLKSKGKIESNSKFVNHCIEELYKKTEKLNLVVY